MVAAAMIGSAVIGGVTSSMGNKAQADAAQNGANAQLQASREQIALQREMLDRATRLLQPYVDQGGQADAYLDALLYGEGNYGGGRGGEPDPQAYLTAHPDVAAAWQNMQASGQGAQFQNDPLKFAQWHYDTHGKAAGWQMPTTQAGTGERVTRDQVMALIRQNPLYQQADDDLIARYDEANRAFGEENRLTQSELRRSLQITGAERKRFRNLTNQDYAARKGYTDKALADRRELTDRYQGQNLDRMAATIGVTGLAGNAQRAADDRANGYSLEMADTERGWRGDDLDARTAGYRDAEDRFFAGKRDAYGNYYGNRRDSTLRKNATRASAYDARSAGRAAAYGDYAAGLSGRSDRGYSAATGQASAGQNFADAASDALGRGADAYADAQRTIGQSRADMWGDIGSTAADAWGYISNSQKQQQPKSRKYAYGS